MDGEHDHPEMPDAAEIEAAFAAGDSAAVISIFEQYRRKCAALQAELDADRRTPHKWENKPETVGALLRDREMEFRALVEHSPDGIIRLDRDFRIIYANSAAAEMMHCRREELLGKAPYDFSMPMHIVFLWQGGLERALASGQKESFEYEFDTLNALHYLRIVMIPEFDRNGTVETVLAVTRDISEQKKTAVALRESEERFKLALESSPVTVFAQDGDLRYTWVYSSHPGWTVDMFIGHTDQDIFSLHDSEEMSLLKQTVLRTGKTVRGEYTVTDASGKTWLDLTVVPLRNNEKEIVGIIGAALDVTERKQAEKTLREAYEQLQEQSAEMETQSEEIQVASEEIEMKSEEALAYAREIEVINRELERANEAIGEREDLYRSLFELSAIGNCQADPNTGRFLRVNDRYCEITGYPREELLTATLYDLTWFEDREEDGEKISRLLRGEIPEYRNEKRLIHRDGHIVWVIATARMIRDSRGEPSCMIGTLMDITKRQDAEKRISQFRREQEAFMRHEVKNLLAPMQLFSELLLQDGENFSAQQIQYLQRIAESAERAIGFIDAMRRIHEIESGKHILRPKAYPLDGIIWQSIQNLGPFARRNGVTVLFHTPEKEALMPLDRDLMPGVFTNLILNAVEHVAPLSNPEEKIVSIDFTGENGRFTVRINNRGAPVPPERLATFFEKYNPGPEKKQGTGLGTTYAWLVIKAHGGDIQAASSAEEGTTVTVMLPAG
jgi:two-component system CheB/CheR fusion protein